MATQENYEIPIFLIQGFLDSGKTTFISETIAAGQFDEAQKKLVIILEEGETEYDEKLMKKHGMDVVVLSKDEFNATKLEQLDKQYDPWLVIIEYNGMWESSIIDNMKMPFGWRIYQRIVLFNAQTFQLMWNNMKGLGTDAVKEAEMIVFNRCETGMNLGSYRRSVKVLNPAAQIIFENTSGDMVSIAEQLPYDIDAPVIEVEDEDYGIFYMDMNERPQIYHNKRVRFKAQAFVGKKFKKGTFAPGRRAMTCCADDIAFIGYICDYPNADEIENKSWITFEATVKYEFSMAYRKKGPVYHDAVVSPAEPAAQELVYF
ncbi:MAG: GTP-binding protein [Lachnospiraceae bacterium]